MDNDAVVSVVFIYGLGAAVGIAWVVSVFADIFIANYGTPVALHGLMGTVVGSVFADASLRKARKRLQGQVAAAGRDHENGDE